MANPRLTPEPGPFRADQLRDGDDGLPPASARVRESADTIV